MVTLVITLLWYRNRIEKGGKPMKEQSGSMLSIVDDGKGYDVYINATGKDCVDMLYQLTKYISELLEIETADLLLFLATKSL